MQFAKKKVPLNDDSTAKAQVPARTIKDLDNEDLKSNIHSCATIPGIRDAKKFGRDVDPSDKEVLCRRNHTHTSTAAPPGPSSNASAESSSFADSVKSNTVALSKPRISFEDPIDLEDLAFDEEETGKAARLKRIRRRRLISSTPSEKTKKFMNTIFLSPDDAGV